MAELITIRNLWIVIDWRSCHFLYHRLYACTADKGRIVGYKDHKTYGDSSIYGVNR